MRPSQRSFLSAFLLLVTVSAWAQMGGKAVFRVLDIPSSARISALGGSPVAVYDNDLNLGLFNPGLLNASMGRQVTLSYLPYIDGINIGYVGYGHHFDSAGVTMSGSVQYVSYGTMTRRDETGQEIGTFTAGEYVVQLGGAKAVDSLFTVGANLKYITSNLDSYKAGGVAMDLGAVFVKRALGLTLAATLRNIGWVTKGYTDTKEKLPFQAQFAASYKFRHAPFRIGLSLDNLQQWDLTYDDPNDRSSIDPLTGEVIEKKVTTVQRVMWHTVPNVEVMLSKNFMLRFAYNYKRRQELRFDTKPALTGVSFGLGLRVSKLHVSYSYAQFNPAGASNTITLAMRFGELGRSGG